MACLALDQTFLLPTAAESMGSYMRATAASSAILRTKSRDTERPRLDSFISCTTNVREIRATASRLARSSGSGERRRTSRFSSHGVTTRPIQRVNPIGASANAKANNLAVFQVDSTIGHV